LLLAQGVVPPVSADPLEDWIRYPEGEPDLESRMLAVAARATNGGGLNGLGTERAEPIIDSDGLLRFRDRWASLSPVERLLAEAMVERFGAVVARESLARRAWPHGTSSRNALDVHMLRLRRRISSIGLEIRTVRARGYLLQEASDEMAYAH
jgi:DNA-binding response OmpR family regulator